MLKNYGTYLPTNAKYYITPFFINKKVEKCPVWDILLTKFADFTTVLLCEPKYLRLVLMLPE